MDDKDYEARAQAHIAAIKKSSKAMVEDAAVRAVHKVMAEFEAKSDERLMEDWGPGPHECHSLPERGPEQPAQQEPVECANGCRGFVKHSPPAQRTWVNATTWRGLTDEEITDIWAEASPYYHEDDFARAIEAKLKEKNT